MDEGGSAFKVVTGKTTGNPRKA
jgi:hypothetical protein